jgi:hypothetical protein
MTPRNKPDQIPVTEEILAAVKPPRASYTDAERAELTAWLDGIAPYAPAHLLPSE